MVDSLRDFFNAWTRRILRRPDSSPRELYLDALDRCIRVPNPHPVHPADSGRGLWADVAPEIVVMHDHAVGRSINRPRDASTVAWPD